MAQCAGWAATKIKTHYVGVVLQLLILFFSFGQIQLGVIVKNRLLQEWPQGDGVRERAML